MSHVVCAVQARFDVFVLRVEMYSLDWHVVSGKHSRFSYCEGALDW